MNPTDLHNLRTAMRQGKALEIAMTEPSKTPRTDALWKPRAIGDHNHILLFAENSRDDEYELCRSLERELAEAKGALSDGNAKARQDALEEVASRIERMLDSTTWESLPQTIRNMKRENEIGILCDNCGYEHGTHRKGDNACPLFDRADPGFHSTYKWKPKGENAVCHADLIKRLDECRRMIGNMCSEGRPPKMSIPCRPDVDEDVVICETIKQAMVALGNPVLSQVSQSDRDDAAVNHALVMAHMLLGRIRDNRGTVPFFEANAVMGMIDALLPKSLAVNTGHAQSVPQEKT